MDNNREVTAGDILTNDLLVSNLRRQGDHVLARSYEAKGIVLAAKLQAQEIAKALQGGGNG